LRTKDDFIKHKTFYVKIIETPSKCSLTDYTETLANRRFQGDHLATFFTIAIFRRTIYDNFRFS